VTATDVIARRIAVIMGSSGSGRGLLALLEPMLESGGAFEIQGVFLEEDEASHAAGLPFVKEVCRVTYSVREFTSDEFEHSLALHVRTARRAFSVRAARAGVPHSFRNVRGSGLRLLCDAAEAADITVFEPEHLMLPRLVQPLPGRQPRRRIAALLNDVHSASEVLRTSLLLAAGDSRDITVLLSPDSESGAATAVLRDLVRDILPRQPAALRFLKGEESTALCTETRDLGATIAVLSAQGVLGRDGALQVLRERMPCPVCLVRTSATQAGEDAA
jgi:hypothetical protein